MPICAFHLAIFFLFYTTIKDPEYSTSFAFSPSITMPTKVANDSEFCFVFFFGYAFV